MADGFLMDYPSMGSACYFTSLEALLRDSTSRFLAAVSNVANEANEDLAVSDAANEDLAKFCPLFAGILTTYSDPPLEAVWFFSAVMFHDAPDDLRSILHILSVFTASSRSAAKPLALLAPVVSELSHSTKPRKKIDSLVEAVFRYIRICSSRPARGKVDADAGRLLPGFEELVKVWSVLRTTDSCPFQVLFPLVGNDVRKELKKEGCNVAFLAGVVVAEAILLRLYLKVQGASEEQRSELQNELRNLAVDSIRALAADSIRASQNQQFFGVLLNMLVNSSSLPVYPGMSVADEKLVRVALRDALILDYPVPSGAEVDEADSSLLDALILDYPVPSGAEVAEADSSLFHIFVSRLVITVDAINDARHKGDIGKATSYINAFVTSNIPSYLSSWVKCQAGTDQVGKLFGTRPHSFLEWLVDLQDKGLEVFGENCSWIKERLMHDEGMNDNQSRSISQSDADHLITDEQNHQEGMDTKGVEEEEAVEMEMEDNASMAAAHSKIAMVNDKRKRKDCGTEDATVVKFVKYKAEDMSVKDFLQATEMS